MLDEGGPHSAFFFEEHGSVAGSENLFESDLARSQGQLSISNCKMVQMFVGCMLRHSWMRMMMEVFDGFILSHRYVLSTFMVYPGRFRKSEGRGQER